MGGGGGGRGARIGEKGEKNRSEGSGEKGLELSGWGNFWRAKKNQINFKYNRTSRPINFGKNSGEEVMSSRHGGVG